MKLEKLLFISLIFNALVFILATVALALNYNQINLIVCAFSLLSFIWIIISFNKITKIEHQSTQKLQILQKELEHQKLQVKIQEEEILHQIRFLKEQGKLIEEQKKQLEDSIHYAFRIQQAILPPFYYIDKILLDYFILYLPKSIVSGDFYYIEQVNDYIIVAAVDCTGHGVPGAMMSVIGYDLLNQAVKINQITKPSQILSFIDKGVSDFLRQTYNESGVNDGMDISVVSIHKYFHLVEYAGAYHELYYIHKGKLIEIKGDKLPIGVNYDGITDEYTNHALHINKGDIIYLFSDGYADQFGGPYNKKFKYKQMKDLFINISTKSLSEQKEIIASTFQHWKGTNEQVDDVLVMGIRI
ncbi:MAG: SpoIIE family protein phosphatase [Bacteroidales bacterium]|nr:SpoIIE family protein phosphatase [Bacteroidales bacterium]